MNILQVPKLLTFRSRLTSNNFLQILSPQAETPTNQIRRQDLKSPQASNRSSQVSKPSPQALLSLEPLLLKSLQKSEDKVFKKSTRKKISQQPPEGQSDKCTLF
jgi:hypothetical protein